MKVWREEWRQALRHLAAARFFLPESLAGESLLAEAELNSYLHHTEFGLALEVLEFMGKANTGYAEEALFWSEMAPAAQDIGLYSASSQYDARARALLHASPGT